jgi:hypothetical protein
MEQFKQYGIISLLGIAFFAGLYSSIQLFEWFFFPWLQLGILSILTCIIAAIQYTNSERNSGRFITITWTFIALEWLICLILFNQPNLMMEKVHYIFLPLLYFVYFALFQLMLRRDETVVKLGRILFYLLISSTLSFFIWPSTWSALGVELIATIFVGLLLFNKPISAEK